MKFQAQDQIHMPCLAALLWPCTCVLTSTGDTKSKAHATSLATAMQDSQFDPRDLVGFNAHVENVQLDKYLKHRTNPFCEQDGWKEVVVHIQLPVGLHASEDDAPTLRIGPLFHR